MNTERPLRFGIIGCGRIAQRHAAHISRVGKLVACCDIDFERAERLAADFGGKAFESADLLLDSDVEMDVVAICSPNGLHGEHTVKVFRAGHHALCEKPMALSVADCGQMIHEAERASKRLFVVKQNRFNPPVARLKEILEEGSLGKVLSFHLACSWNRGVDYYEGSWKGTSEFDGGILFTQFSHFIDLLFWLLGDVTDISARGSSWPNGREIEFDDTIVTCCRAGDALGTMHFTINAHRKNMEGSITLFCEKGTVKVGGQYLNELEYQELEGAKIEGLPEGNPANNYGTYVGSMSNHDKVYENLVGVIRGEAIIATNGYEGMKTIDIIERIHEQLSMEGKRLQVTGSGQ